MLGREVRTKRRYLRVIHMQVKTTTESIRRQKTEGRQREAEDREPWGIPIFRAWRR